MTVSRTIVHSVQTPLRKRHVERDSLAAAGKNANTPHAFSNHAATQVCLQHFSCMQLLYTPQDYLLVDQPLRVLYFTATWCVRLCSRCSPSDAVCISQHISSTPTALRGHQHVRTTSRCACCAALLAGATCAACCSQRSQRWSPHFLRCVGVIMRPAHQGQQPQLCSSHATRRRAPPTRAPCTPCVCSCRWRLL